MEVKTNNANSRPVTKKLKEEIKKTVPEVIEISWEEIEEKEEVEEEVKSFLRKKEKFEIHYWTFVAAEGDSVELRPEVVNPTSSADGHLRWALGKITREFEIEAGIEPIIPDDLMAKLGRLHPFPMELRSSVEVVSPISTREDAFRRRAKIKDRLDTKVRWGARVVDVDPGVSFRPKTIGEDYETYDEALKAAKEAAENASMYAPRPVAYKVKE
jgi:hypothetical protein